jgi:hypothetical protein
MVTDCESIVARVTSSRRAANVSDARECASSARTNCRTALRLSEMRELDSA